MQRSQPGLQATIGPSQTTTASGPTSLRELGLQHTLDARWPSATSYFGEDHEVKLERGYGR